MKLFVLDTSAHSKSSILCITLFLTLGATMYGASAYFLGVFDAEKAALLAFGLYVFFVSVGLVNIFIIKSPEIFHLIAVLVNPLVFPAYVTSFSMLYYSGRGGDTMMIIHVIIFSITIYYSVVGGILASTSDYLQKRVSGPFIHLNPDGTVTRTFGEGGNGISENRDLDVDFFLYRFRNIILWGGTILGIVVYPFAFKTVYVDQINGGSSTGQFGISLLLLSVYLFAYRAIGEMIIICRLGSDLRKRAIKVRTHSQ